MLDNAVTWFGITIENALSERVEVRVGTTIKSNPRYTLARLLHQGFKLPRPPEEAQESTDPLAGLMAWANKPNSGVKRYKYVPPPEEEGDADGRE